MGTNPLRPRDLVVVASGAAITWKYETDRFRPSQGSVTFATMPEVFTVGSVQVTAESAVVLVARSTQLTDDILLLARLCGQLDGFMSCMLDPDGGSILFATDVAASEAARLASLLFASYNEGELCLGLSLG